MRGIPNFKILKRLAEAYGVPVAKLIEVAEKGSEESVTDPANSSPEIEFVSRGYEKLSDARKKQLNEFLKFLMQQENKEKK
ncbi:MAG: hypothetical protein GWN00_07960 [Aliifodinibius sp.]|nr:hypothetical protein [Fodinibius sp.]NIV11153.1 hypothetical protein [Fodinibius sp.]NIY24743.1 hypothetical protein [Fodinibius sp.]